MGLTKKLLEFTEHHFRQWVERDLQRKRLESEARALAKQNEIIADDLLQALRENKKTEFVRGDFKAAIETSKGTVSWKDEFLRRHGADEAAALSEAAPPREKVKITAVG